MHQHPLVIQVWFSLATALLQSPLVAQSPPAAAQPEVSFVSDVFPILQQHCGECHGSRRQEAEFRIDLAASLHDDRRLVAGSISESEMLHRVRLPEGDESRMPPVGSGLSAAEIRLLELWIRSGAEIPDDFVPEIHWAYQPPVRPQTDSASSESPIDQLVRRRLATRGLQQAPPAAPGVLIRRLSLDLTGLPPDPELVLRYTRAPDESLYQQIVDQFLDSPEFGVRWSRHWLDLARYADSHGFQRDDLRDLWAYRDWVVNALNQDMPYDQFTIEQLAGDLLPDATESQKTATGFHRCVPTNVEAGSLPEETRAEQLIDRVNTTAAVWLGTTLECAQCHDHKYDPFTQQDYYRLLAFFNNTEIEADRKNASQPSSIAFLGPSMQVTEPQRDRERQDVQQAIDQLRTQIAGARRDLQERMEELVQLRRVSLEHQRDAELQSVLQVRKFESSVAGEPWELLADGSVLLTGAEPPDTDLYTVVTAQPLRDVRTIRLEVLTDPSLPGNGPGRGEAARPNFVLHEFRVQHRDAAGITRELRFSAARADFSQQNWDAAGAIDGKSQTGWAIAPQFGSSHFAEFQLQQPLTTAADDELIFELDQHLGKGRTIGRFRLRASPASFADGPEKMSAEFLAVLQKPAQKWTKGDRKILQEQFEAENDELLKFTQELQRQEQLLAALKPHTTLVMVETEPRPTFVFQRGDYRNPGEPVSPGFPAILGGDAVAGGTRLELARWLVSAANPLAARAAVNRWWAELFGAGLVATPEDFGLKGDRPEHAELLDWLAVQLMQNGWSMKSLLREIVLSETYRQSSAVATDASAADAENRWLSRASVFRMDAEMIRDNLLALSGLLDHSQGGPPIYPPQPDGLWKKVGGTQYEYEVSEGTQKYRRSLYIVLKRSAMFPGLMTFDGSMRQTCTVRRSRTNTPMQALMLMNDALSSEAAAALAEFALSSPDEADEVRLANIFFRCTSRPATARELQLLTELLNDQRTAFSDSTASSSEADAVAERAAWQSVCLVILNLHETITRN